MKKLLVFIFLISIILVSWCWKNSDNEFLMKEKCYKYQTDVDNQKTKYWYDYAQVFYSNMYNSCLVDTYTQWDLWFTFEIYDLFDWKSVLNCITWYDNTMWDSLWYDFNKFDFSYYEWQNWVCNMVHDRMFDLLQNQNYEDLSIYLKL